MSTKRTLKHQSNETGAGFHLYQDLEELDEEGNGPVHLALYAGEGGVGTARFDGDGSIDVTIPRALAESIGLVPTKGKPE